MAERNSLVTGGWPSICRNRAARPAAVARLGKSGSKGFRQAAIQAALEDTQGTHRVDPTLLSLLATARITHAVAGRLPLSAKRPASRSPCYTRP